MPWEIKVGEKDRPQKVEEGEGELKFLVINWLQSELLPGVASWKDEMRVDAEC